MIYNYFFREGNKNTLCWFIPIAIGSIIYFSIFGLIYEPFVNIQWDKTKCTEIHKSVSYNNDHNYTIVNWHLTTSDNRLGTACATHSARDSIIKKPFGDKFPYERDERFGDMLLWHCSKCKDSTCSEYMKLDINNKQCFVSKTKTHKFNKINFHDISLDVDRDIPYYPYYDWIFLHWNLMIFVPVFIMSTMDGNNSKFKLEMTKYLNSYTIKKYELNKYFTMLFSLMDFIHMIFLGIIIFRNLNLNFYSGEVYFPIIVMLYFWSASIPIIFNRIYKLHFS
ncbi:unnamed protein product, partial [marine sediment metagenome]